MVENRKRRCEFLRDPRIMSDQPAGVEDLRPSFSLRDQLCELRRSVLFSGIRQGRFNAQPIRKPATVKRVGESA
jgi:hypothetical protein